jgi:hypothetical protein
MRHGEKPFEPPMNADRTKVNRESKTRNPFY